MQPASKNGLPTRPTSQDFLIPHIFSDGVFGSS
jgi:hypothetical protein